MADKPCQAGAKIRGAYFLLTVNIEDLAPSKLRLTLQALGRMATVAISSSSNVCDAPAEETTTSSRV